MSHLRWLFLLNFVKVFSKLLPHAHLNNSFWENPWYSVDNSLLSELLLTNVLILSIVHRLFIWLHLNLGLAGGFWASIALGQRMVVLSHLL
ncbi:hypothetical protein BBI11_03860 [Planococcus maritimus]|nr:hypothetical protein BBI11_03860 [Planococcus maritimus]